MTAAFARRIAGWTSLALGKLGTLLLLWQGMRMAEPDAVGRAAAAAAGFDGCWSKPIDMQAIIGELRRRAAAVGPTRSS